MVRARVRLRVVLAGATLALVAMAAPAGAQDPGSTSSTVPTTATTAVPDGPVTGPVAADAGARGGAVTSATESLADVGYEEREVFLSGLATVYGPAGIWGSGGRWATADLGELPYRTRLLVRRPTDPGRFSGTVFVSWLNVDSAVDTDPDWTQIGEEVVREGAVWVGVSAQSLGINGLLGARAWDPARYGLLDVPGDAASYDIFTDAADALRAPGSVDPLAGLGDQRRLIAVGQSQSAQRLVTYLNAFQPSTHAYDGYLLISRYRGAAPLGRVLLPSSEAVDPDGPDGRPYLPDPLAALLSGPPRAKIRDDTTVPVFTVLTETEARQARSIARPDSDRFRTWEVAGASHTDRTATEALVAKLRRDFPTVPLGQLECADANTFPTRYALRAAARALAVWVDDGPAPPTAPPLELDGAGAVVRDTLGNAKGGLRLPQIEVPTARYTGESVGDGYCALTGATVPFTEDQEAKLYPSPEAYVVALAAAVQDAVDAGYLLVEDAAELLDVTPVPGSTATAAAIAASAGVAAPVAAPERSADVSEGSSAAGSAGAASPTAAPDRGDRSWMATTGRDLITPFLLGLLLLLNGKVVLTISHQRRRPEH